MPTLDETPQQTLRGAEILCACCQSTIRPQTCSECGVNHFVGHTRNCPCLREDHLAHEADQSVS